MVDGNGCLPTFILIAQLSNNELSCHNELSWVDGLAGFDLVKDKSQFDKWSNLKAFKS